MDAWLDWRVKFLGITAIKTFVPGASAVIDFAEAAYALSQGDKLGAAINIVSGVGGILTFGATGSVTEAMKGSAKTAVVSTAKETAKQAKKAATTKVGQEFAKSLATGMVQGSKEVAIQSAKQTAKAAGKEATKTVGKMVSKEIAKGVVNEAVEEVLRQGTKITLERLGHNTALAIVSSGGRQVMISCGESVSEEILKQLSAGFLEFIKQNEKHVFELTLEVAKTAAEKEFMKNAYKLLGIEYGTATVKGVIKLLNP